MIEEELSRFYAPRRKSKRLAFFVLRRSFGRLKPTATNEPILTARKIRLGLDWVKC